MSDDRTTHASCNPTQPIQPSHNRVSNKRNISTAKATCTAVTAEHKAEMAEIEQDLDDFHAKKGQFIQEMSTKHNKTVKFFLNLLLNMSGIKLTHGPGLCNTIIHDLSVKANEVLQDQLDDIIEVIKGGYDGYIKGMDEAEKAGLLTQLMEYQAPKKHGVRSNNKAVSIDALGVANHIGDEITALYEWTGVQAFMVMLHGNPDNAALPHCVDSAGSLSFLTQVIDILPLDLLCKYEQWCCTQTDGMHESNTATEVRKEIIKLILLGLHMCKVTSNKKQLMSYKHYDSDVYAAMKVELAGWPANIPFHSLGKIGEMNQLHTLRNKLCTGVPPKVLVVGCHSMGVGGMSTRRAV
ncbi:hypothetical protein C8J57DRAFT_1515512 [Mycena rebaudengoi]|nr:hypothetical protein C8J57DRAFT_1515512 [Mycena rebaudengoi]